MFKKKLAFYIVIMLIAHLCYGQKVITNYIDRFLPVSKELSGEFGIPVAIILGVSILESGSGTSKNCRQLNNYFGVTGRNQLKKRHSAYKKYVSAEESFRDFCEILSRKNFYSSLKYHMEYNRWLVSMNHASYAGAKNVWITRITSLVKKYKLNSYDK